MTHGNELRRASVREEPLVGRDVVEDGDTGACGAGRGGAGQSGTCTCSAPLRRLKSGTCMCTVRACTHMTEVKDGIHWDRMGWDGMGWDGMGWDGMG